MSEDDTADDDWFERAVAGADAGETAEDDDHANERGDGQAADDDGRAEADDDGRGGEEADDSPGGESGDGDGGDGEETGMGGFDGADPDADALDAAFEAAAAEAGDGTGEGATDADPIAGGDEGSPFDGAGEEDHFDGGSGGAFGGGDEAGGELFEDDFASAFGSAGDDDGFDEEDFDSEIPRLDVGIGGLDRMIRGGIPRRHLVVAIGSAGTGKTTFGLQYLNHGLENGENGVFITLEQSHDAILDTAAEYGWDFEAYEAAGELAVIDLDPIEMANSLDNIRGELPRLIEEFDADRFVLDSVSLLEMMYDDQSRRRTEVYDFTRSLKRAGVTTLLTSEADEDNAYASRHGIIEYLTDAVFVLQYVRAENQETRLAVEIQKIRNANHSRETKPYEITDGGISVYEQANIF